MKKYLTLAFATVLTLGVFVPQAVLAVGQSCADGCAANEYCDTSIDICALTQVGGGGGGGGGAGGGLNITKLQAWADSIKFLVNGVAVPLLTAVAFIVFLWGVFNYFILGGADEEKRTKGRVFVMYGIIGFVLIFSVWGIVNVGTSLLGVGTGARGASLPYPTL